MNNATSSSDVVPVITNENFPVSVVPIFATQSAQYYDSVVQVITRANSVYNEFLRSEEGLGFNGQVCHSQQSPNIITIPGVTGLPHWRQCRILAGL